MAKDNALIGLVVGLGAVYLLTSGKAEDRTGRGGVSFNLSFPDFAQRTQETLSNLGSAIPNLQVPQISMPSIPQFKMPTFEMPDITAPFKNLADTIKQETSNVLNAGVTTGQESLGTKVGRFFGDVVGGAFKGGFDVGKKFIGEPLADFMNRQKQPATTTGKKIPLWERLLALNFLPAVFSMKTIQIIRGVPAQPKTLGSQQVNTNNPVVQVVEKIKATTQKATRDITTITTKAVAQPRTAVSSGTTVYNPRLQKSISVPKGATPELIKAMKSPYWNPAY
jgi:hypothetical protein